jgi:hypothetical protein
MRNNSAVVATFEALVFDDLETGWAGVSCAVGTLMHRNVSRETWVREVCHNEIEICHVGLRTKRKQSMEGKIVLLNPDVKLTDLYTYLDC